MDVCFTKIKDFLGAFGIGFLAPFTYVIPNLAVSVAIAAVPPNDRNLNTIIKKCCICIQTMLLKKQMNCLMILIMVEDIKKVPIKKGRFYCGRSRSWSRR